MNQLIYNFLNEIEDANKIKEMSVEEFAKLVKSNNLISENDALQLIESFKRISSKKSAEDEANDDDQRKKKYRNQHKQSNIQTVDKSEKTEIVKENEIDDDSIER